ncbi:MAG: NYN domain-containing protein [Nibricoccus sp.]
MNTNPASNENIALLIDADNAPAAKISFIITELASYGVVNIRRAYGNWKKPHLSAWENVLHEYAIQPQQHFDITKGKNASDMALLIDAMDILYTKSVDTFSLVSSDSDFTPLVLRLRADGKHVIGFGNHNAPEPFVNSCTRFLYLDDSDNKKTDGQPAKPTTARLKTDAKLIAMLRSAIEANDDEEGWAQLGAIGNHLSNQGPFDSRNYGFSKLSGLFAALKDQFTTKTSTSGDVIRHWVRIRDDRQLRSPGNRPDF